MIRSLVAFGAGLVVLALVIFAFMINARIDATVTQNQTFAERQQGALDARSPIWPVIGGLALAGGAACVGIGMSRWREG
ncbi:MAG TPA: hypothetical protein VHD57_00270 [Vicinamibacterales bacterium]|mgnify:FL=1|jgi:hypothetical protein|nr:hypothetical protein [Vicinamibacterales bacterium]